MYRTQGNHLEDLLLQSIKADDLSGYLAFKTAMSVLNANHVSLLMFHKPMSHRSCLVAHASWLVASSLISHACF